MSNYDNIVQKHAEILRKEKNIILHGAPGTGKTHMARDIAARIVSGVAGKDYDSLNEDQKKRIGFVQFHPSYDYTDFVEGLRPVMIDEEEMGFELKDGIFKKFIEGIEPDKQPPSAEELVEWYFKNIDFRNKKYITHYVGNIEYITHYVGDIEYKFLKECQFCYDERYIWHLYEVSSNGYSGFSHKFEKNDLIKQLKNIKTMSFEELSKEGYEPTLFPENDMNHFYHPVAKDILNEWKKRRREYVFIIDEINRGEISKIFGELFFSIDPGYRGEKGAVSTQYSNMHDDPEEKLYIPDNVYIIGTMNDIDRSVDTFDLAMRRRFRFIEVTAQDQEDMLDQLDYENSELFKNEDEDWKKRFTGLKISKDAKKRMESLNEEIKNNTPGLNRNYQIGPAYFLNLKNCIDDNEKNETEKKEKAFKKLWEDYLCSLLKEYVKGFENEKGILDSLAKAYGYKSDGKGSA